MRLDRHAARPASSPAACEERRQRPRCASFHFVATSDQRLAVGRAGLRRAPRPMSSATVRAAARASSSSRGLPVTRSGVARKVPVRDQVLAPRTSSKSSVSDGCGKPGVRRVLRVGDHLVRLVQVVQPVAVDEAVLQPGARDAAAPAFEDERAAPAAGFGVGQRRRRARARRAPRPLRPSRAPTTATAAARCRRARSRTIGQQSQPSMIARARAGRRCSTARAASRGASRQTPMRRRARCRCAANDSTGGALRRIRRRRRPDATSAARGSSPPARR